MNDQTQQAAATPAGAASRAEGANLTAVLAGWKPMETAPKDGTEIELLIQHTNYQYAETDEERAMWQGAMPGQWIDFNGGGWCWFGLCGTPIGWRQQ